MVLSVSHFGSTPLSLLNRVKSRDRDAWFTFCDLYAPLVYYWCRSSGLTQDETEEVAQLVFGRLATSIHRFEKCETRHRFRAWLWVLTRNLIQDFRRGQNRRIRTVGGEVGDQLLAQQASGDPGAVLPEEVDAFTSPDENRQLLLRMLQQVESRHEPSVWRAFWRVVIDGEPTSDVARDLGLSANYVRQIKCRILRQLRTEFGELLD